MIIWMEKAAGVNAEQRERLRQYAEQYGPLWKDRLLTQWWVGSDADEPNGYLLRQVRNQFGPKWLDKFQL